MREVFGEILDFFLKLFLSYCPFSSIGPSLAPFQDGGHDSKMAAMAPIWPPRPPVTR